MKRVILETKLHPGLIQAGTNDNLVKHRKGVADDSTLKIRRRISAKNTDPSLITSIPRNLQIDGREEIMAIKKKIKNSDTILAFISISGLILAFIEVKLSIVGS